MNYKMLKKMALGLALVVTVTSVNVPAKAAEAPAFNKASVSVKVGQTKKLKVKNAEWKLKKAVSSDENVATAKVKGKKQLVKVTGVSTGNATVVATFKKADKKQTVAVAVAVKDNVVTKAAKDYFANYTDRKKQVADVTKLIDENASDYLIIDIRRADDYAANHLKGAVNIPYATIGESLEMIPDDIPVYLNCYSGQTASQTVALLATAGKDAYNIQGGWNGISATEGIDAYLETTENKVSDKTYAVDAEIKEAIKAYYEAANAANSFNFPAADYAKLIEEGKDNAYTLVDIRSAEDHAKSYIPGADVNVPFPTAMPAGFDNIPKDKPVIVQCYSGQTASQTVAILRLLGYEAYNLSGGWNGWTKAELPIVEETVVTKAAKDYFRNAPANVNKYSVAEVLAKIDAGEKMLIIDIRRADDYAKGHLKGAVNVPYATIGESLELIPDDIPVYLNCYSGQTASQTIALLNVAGKQAGNIQGGWNGISATEGIDAYLETTENKLSGKTYAVDAEIKEAIKAYYETANAANSFNFPAADYAKLIEEGKDDAYTLVDIRSAEDHAKSYISGADVNVPFPGAMPAGFENIPKDKPVIVQCYSGQTASQTVAILRLLGYEAYNLSGGWNGWVAAELPVVEK